MNGFAVAMRTYHCHVTSPLTSIPTPDRKLSFEHRNRLQNCARLIPPATAAHLSPRSNLWDSEEERDYPAPSPGCRVLSPFSRHSPVILCIAPPRNCSLLYISANFLHHSAQRAPPLHAIARSSSRTAPASSPQLRCEHKANRECVLN